MSGSRKRRRSFSDDDEVGGFIAEINDPGPSMTRYEPPKSKRSKTLNGVGYGAGAVIYKKRFLSIEPSNVLCLEFREGFKTSRVELRHLNTRTMNGFFQMSCSCDDIRKDCKHVKWAILLFIKTYIKSYYMSRKLVDPDRTEAIHKDTEELAIYNHFLDIVYRINKDKSINEHLEVLNELRICPTLHKMKMSFQILDGILYRVDLFFNRILIFKCNCCFFENYRKTRYCRHIRTIVSYILDFFAELLDRSRNYLLMAPDEEEELCKIFEMLKI